MYQKNDVLIGTVEGLGSNGEGIIRQEGVTFFVPFCLLGEKVKFLLLKKKDNIGYGKMLEVIEPSKERTEAKCPVFARCGGCQLQHASYSSQLSFKREMVRNTLQKIGGISARVEEVVKSAKEFGYRNKLQLPVGADKNGELAIGFFAEHSHRIVPIEDCSIHPNWVQDVISALREYAKNNGIKGYDEENRSGEIRHIVVRELDGQFIITLVSTTERLPQIHTFFQRLQGIFRECTLWLNINAKPTNVIFGDRFLLVGGKGYYTAQEKGIFYEAGPKTFVQINADVRGELYEEALRAVTGEGDEVVIDAYSGGGLLTAMVAKRAKRVYGIEIEREASACADGLKEKNNLANMTNICGAVEEKLAGVLQAEKGEKIRLILDPPRAGIHRSVIKAIIQSGIPKIALISCNPTTLARDLGLLTGYLVEEDGQLKKGKGEGRYEIEYIRPYDMFPQTKHVETLVVLSHKKPDGHISVNVEFGEEEGQVSLKDIEKRAKEREPKKKTTYKDIQAYIEEKYGFKVHTSYIAEVKRDLGLPMYDAPNAVEELKKPRQHPTEKMVEAIKDALKYFEII